MNDNTVKPPQDDDDNEKWLCGCCCICSDSPCSGVMQGGFCDDLDCICDEGNENETK